MNIVFLEPLGISKDLLKGKVEAVLPEGHEVKYYDDRVTDTETLIERSKDAEIVVLSNFKYGRDVMESCPNLKMICVAFTGVDHVDMDYCREKGIVVCNCSGYSTVSVADIVFAMAINLGRNIVPCQEAVKRGGTKDGLVGFELEGKTFGVIGLGEIGTRVCRIANAFGCKVIGYSRTPKNIEGVDFRPFEEVLREADILSIHVPQTKETIGMIGKDEIALMKKDAILINTARGPIVDTPALAEALTEGRIAGAGVDVFDIEPPLPLDHPLLHTPNTLVTPHIAFASHQAFEKRGDIVAKNIEMFIKGEPINVMK